MVANARASVPNRHMREDARDTPPSPRPDRGSRSVLSRPAYASPGRPRARSSPHSLFLDRARATRLHRRISGKSSSATHTGNTSRPDATCPRSRAGARASARAKRRSPTAHRANTRLRISSTMTASRITAPSTMSCVYDSMFEQIHHVVEHADQQRAEERRDHAAAAAHQGSCRRRRRRRSTCSSLPMPVCGEPDEKRAMSSMPATAGATARDDVDERLHARDVDAGQTRRFFIAADREHVAPEPRARQARRRRRRRRPSIHSTAIGMPGKPIACSRPCERRSPCRCR